MATNKTKAEAEAHIKAHQVEDFAVSGVEAPYTVFLEKGTEALGAYAHSLEPYLKKLGLPIKLNFQKLELIADVYVCREGQVLNVEQAKILKLLGYKMSSFQLQFLAHRTKSGKFKEFDEGTEYLSKHQD